MTWQGQMALQRLRERPEAKIELSRRWSRRSTCPTSATAGRPLHLDTGSPGRVPAHDLRPDRPLQVAVQQVIKDANVKVADIDHVVLVGGSTGCPRSLTW